MRVELAVGAEQAPFRGGDLPAGMNEPPLRTHDRNGAGERADTSFTFSSGMRI